MSDQLPLSGPSGSPSPALGATSPARGLARGEEREGAGAATIVAIGDELLAGFTLDTNSHWIAERLRGGPETRGAMLIALSGWGKDEDRRRSKGAGIDFHLVKPVDLDALGGLLAGAGSIAGRRHAPRTSAR